MKALARGYVWWLGVAKIGRMVKSCKSCLSVNLKAPVAPLDLAQSTLATHSHRLCRPIYGKVLSEKGRWTYSDLSAGEFAPDLPHKAPFHHRDSAM